MVTQKLKGIRRTKKLERKLSSDDIMPFLKNLPRSWWRDITTGAFGKKGTIDIIGCYNGKFYAFELKQEGEKPEPLQEYNLQKISEAGGVAMIITSVEQLRKLFS